MAEAAAPAVEHQHAPHPAWQLVDSMVVVACGVILAVALEWLYTEIRARRVAARADLINAQTSVQHATAANNPPDVPEPPQE